MNEEMQDARKEIVGFTEIRKEKDERIEHLKIQSESYRVKYEEFLQKFESTHSEYEKIKELYDSISHDYTETVEKLRITNKVRNDLDV